MRYNLAVLRPPACDLISVRIMSIPKERVYQGKERQSQGRFRIGGPGIDMHCSMRLSACLVCCEFET